MAIGEVSTVAAGVTRFDFVLGFHHWGTKEALLGARVAKPEWFADGKRDTRGRRVLTVKAVDNGQTVLCVNQGWRYQVTTYYAGVKRERRELQWLRGRAAT